MFFSSIILSILIGRLRGGRIAGLGDMRIRKIGWALLGFLVRFGLSMAPGRVLLPAWLAAGVHLSAYIMVIYTVAWNLNLRGAPWIGIGTALNLLVIGANGGRMPMSPIALQMAGVEPPAGSFTHQVLTESTRLKFLGDVLAIPKPLWAACVYSIGDALMIVGVFLLIQSAMLGSREGVSERDRWRARVRGCS